MIEEEGKCRAEAEARGLPEDTSEKETGQRESEEKIGRETKSGKNTLQ